MTAVVTSQELEIVLGDEHISFTTSKIGSLVDVQECKDPDGLRCFYYLVQVSPDQAIAELFGDFLQKNVRIVNGPAGPSLSIVQ